VVAGKPCFPFIDSPSITSQQDRDLHVTVKALAHDHMYDIAVIERPWPLARTWIAKAPLAISD
jgi:hypothetical protein